MHYYVQTHHKAAQVSLYSCLLLSNSFREVKDHQILQKWLRCNLVLLIFALDITSKIMNGLPEEVLHDTILTGKSHHHVFTCEMKVARDYSEGVCSFIPEKQEDICTPLHQ